MGNSVASWLFPAVVRPDGKRQHMIYFLASHAFAIAFWGAAAWWLARYLPAERP